MTALRLYLDEDVRPLLAEVLQERGYDVVSAVRLGHLAWPDARHFEHAISAKRAIFTFNIRDFVPLANAAIVEKRPFPGLIVSQQLAFGELLRRVLRLLGQHTADDLQNQITWLNDFR
jgi:hypothetical protein